MSKFIVLAPLDVDISPVIVDHFYCKWVLTLYEEPGNARLS